MALAAESSSGATFIGVRKKVTSSLAALTAAASEAAASAALGSVESAVQPMIAASPPAVSKPPTPVPRLWRPRRSNRCPADAGGGVTNVFSGVGA
jgi:hypothetical protein